MGLTKGRWDGTGTRARRALGVKKCSSFRRVMQCIKKTTHTHHKKMIRKTFIAPRTGQKKSGVPKKEGTPRALHAMPHTGTPPWLTVQARDPDDSA